MQLPKLCYSNDTLQCQRRVDKSNKNNVKNKHLYTNLACKSCEKFVYKLECFQLS